MNTPDISVIVCVYGVEQYIGQSLRSLLDQDLAPGRMEVILVDDRTPDRSMEVAAEVIEQYPELKPYIHTITHAENMGVSHSRQDGVNAASGEFVIHFDPDDLLRKDSYSTLLEEQKRSDADLVICDYASFNGRSMRHNQAHIQRPAKPDALQVARQVSGNRAPQLHGSLCNKLIRRDLYHANSFPPGINVAEDALALFDMLEHRNPRIAYVHRVLYGYRVGRNGSMVTGSNAVSRLPLMERIAALAAGASTPEWAEIYRAYLANFLYLNVYCSEMPPRQMAEQFGRYANCVSAYRVISAPERAMMRRGLAGKSLPSRKLRMLPRIFRYIKRRILH